MSAAADDCGACDRFATPNVEPCTAAWLLVKGGKGGLRIAAALMRKYLGHVEAAPLPPWEE